MFYTGIGSRKIPKEVARRFVSYGITLARLGLTLRSGAADGADLAFELGCDRAKGKKEIYLPWKGFNHSNSNLYDVTPTALNLAEEVWDASRSSPFKYLKQATKLFMGRNIYQVVGYTLDTNSDFVVCWTPDGCASASERTDKTGGTGQAIAYAADRNIPVFNLQREGAEQDFMVFLKKRYGNVS